MQLRSIQYNSGQFNASRTDADADVADVADVVDVADVADGADVAYVADGTDVAGAYADAADTYHAGIDADAENAAEVNDDADDDDSCRCQCNNTCRSAPISLGRANALFNNCLTRQKA